MAPSSTRPFAAGLGPDHYPTQTAAWADYDLDGDLDLYIGNETTETFVAPGQLFQNQGRRHLHRCGPRRRC